MTTTLLAVFAHPDDEAFGTGATLAHYAALGWRVALVCTTNGDVGEIADPSLATPETLAHVRQNELRCAAGALGVHEVIFLNYRDSGMAGTPENQDSRAFVNAPADEVVRRLVSVIRSVRPDVVVTFDPDGGYGHPDHIATHSHTVAAFHAAGDLAQYPEQGAPHQAQRLFYSVLPRSFWLEMRTHLDAAGVDTSDWDSADQDAWGWPDDRVHVTVHAADAVDAKLAALHCHATQFGPDNWFRKLPDDAMRKVLGREHYFLAWPEVEEDWRSDGLVGW